MPLQDQETSVVGYAFLFFFYICFTVLQNNLLLFNSAWLRWTKFLGTISKLWDYLSVGWSLHLLMALDIFLSKYLSYISSIQYLELF